MEKMGVANAMGPLRIPNLEPGPKPQASRSIFQGAILGLRFTVKSQTLATPLPSGQRSCRQCQWLPVTGLPRALQLYGLGRDAV